MDLEPKSRQSVKKITSFRPYVFKEALFQQNMEPWVYGALPDERKNSHSIPGGKYDDSIKRNTSEWICTGPEEVRLHLFHPPYQGRTSFMCPSSDF